MCVLHNPHELVDIGEADVHGLPTRAVEELSAIGAPPSTHLLRHKKVFERHSEEDERQYLGLHAVRHCAVWRGWAWGGWGGRRRAPVRFLRTTQIWRHVGALLLLFLL